MHQQQQVTWLGGIANHEDIFQPLYRMLLAVHTAASCQAMRTRIPKVAETLQAASACLQQVDPNPVLSALLAQTTAMWTAEKTDNDMQVQQVIRCLLCSFGMYCTFLYTMSTLRGSCDHVGWLCVCVYSRWSLTSALCMAVELTDLQLYEFALIVARYRGLAKSPNGLLYTQNVCCM